MFRFLKNLFKRKPIYNECFDAEDTEGNKMRVCKNRVIASRAPTPKDFNYTHGTEWIHEDKKYILSHDWLVCMEKVKRVHKQHKMKKRFDKNELINKKFGMLLVEEFSHVVREGHIIKYYWKCLCDCGKNTTITTSHIRNKKNLSCGCAQHPSLGNLSKLDWKKVSRIRNNKKNISTASFADSFGVTCRTIVNVLSMKTWSDNNERAHELKLKSEQAA